MNKITVGLIGYGNVGSGVVKFLQRKRNYIRKKFNIEVALKTICDRSIAKKNTEGLAPIILTSDINAILNDPEIEVVIELIGGLNPAKEIILTALKQGKHVVTANKELIAHYGKELFQEAHMRERNIYFESSVMAGVPTIKAITEGVAGNQFNRLYGIINGTCNYILSQMTQKNYTFSQALEEAQKNGFAESNPTLDINGMDSAHKLAILVSLTMGKFINLKEIHTEGITHISHEDIEHAESLNLTIKLLAIAKKVNKEIDARVHPTLISKDHPLASINGIFNAIFLDTDPLGDILLSGQGAGQMSAASGVVSDLINFASRQGSKATSFPANLHAESATTVIKSIDQIESKFYIRIMAIDKPGVLSQITGILGQHNIGINSVTQKVHNRMAAVPVVMLTDYALENMVRIALDEIHKTTVIKSKPVVIRMENL